MDAYKTRGKSYPVNWTVIDASLSGRLHEVFVVTEWRDNCIYRTKSVGFVVATTEHSPVKHPGAYLNSPSLDYVTHLCKLWKPRRQR